MHQLTIRGYGLMHLGDADRPYYLGTFQARVFCEHRGVELDAYQQAVAAMTGERGLLDSILICDLVYSALVAGARRDKLDVDFTADDVVFWVDEAQPDELRKLFDTARSMGAPADEAPGKARGPKPTK